MSNAPLFFVVGLSFCLCKGTPPEVGTSSNVRCRTVFTEQEDNFIVEEILRIPGNVERIGGKSLWEDIQEKHREKWKQDTPGFPCERSYDSLRQRFTKTLIQNHPNNKVKVPETLVKRFPKLTENKPKRGPRYPYTSEETEFILEELSNPSYIRLQAASTLKAIKTKHDEKRKEGCHGFKTERTVPSIRAHMISMKERGLPSNAGLKKRSTYRQAGSSSESTLLKHTNESQETHGYEDGDFEAWFENLSEEPINIEPPDFR